LRIQYAPRFNLCRGYELKNKFPTYIVRDFELLRRKVEIKKTILYWRE